MNNAWYIRFIRCPNCLSPLRHQIGSFCSSCSFSDESGRDLRIRESRERLVTFKDLPGVSPAGCLLSIDTTLPPITYTGPKATRDSTELMSEVSHRLQHGGTVLDLGCGPRDQAPCLESLGFSYVGVDYSNEAADFLADAHALPLTDATLDCVFSYAVLEHLHNPFLAIQEVSRVLKPGGWFIGTVSQGEPFHNSYFHHTPWGIVSLIGSVPALEIVRMWGSNDTLGSLATMGRYSRLIRWCLRFLDFMNRKLPWLTPRKMRWPVKDKELDRLFRAGSVCFSIRKRLLPTSVTS